jgi:hypothetical protein
MIFQAFPGISDEGASLRVTPVDKSGARFVEAWLVNS